jgi:hypothetical protein
MSCAMIESDEIAHFVRAASDDVVATLTPAG